MPLRWPAPKVKKPWYCSIHLDLIMEHCALKGKQFAICNQCVKDMMERLLFEGLHESKQVIKRRKERERG